MSHRTHTHAHTLSHSQSHTLLTFYTRQSSHSFCTQDLDSDALRRELFRDHMDALKRRAAEEEKRAKETAVAAYRFVECWFLCSLGGGEEEGCLWFPG